MILGVVGEFDSGLVVSFGTNSCDSEVGFGRSTSTCRVGLNKLRLMLW